MGVYVDPKDSTKEEWLKGFGVVVEWDDVTAHDFVSSLPVVLLDNGAFTAAAVCAHLEELEYFRKDDRPRILYLVNKVDLYEVIPPSYHHILKK